MAKRKTLQEPEIVYNGFIAGVDFNRKFILNDYDKKLFISNNKTLPRGEYYIVLKRVFEKRSLDLNKYYFGAIVRTLADHIGYTLDEMHEILKIKFNSEKKFNVKKNRELPPVSRSTTELDNSMFMEYCNKIKIWASMGGDEEITDRYSLQLDSPVIILDPDQYEIEMYEKKGNKT